MRFGIHGSSVRDHLCLVLREGYRNPDVLCKAAVR